MKNFLISKLNLILFILVLLWWIGIIWNLIILFFPNLILALPILKYNYSLVCHVQEHKLYDFFDATTLVCSRCFGIYSGALFSSIGILLGLKLKVSTKLLLFISIPLFIDVILSSFGIYNYSKHFALFTGLLLGSVGFVYFRNALILLFEKNLDNN